MDCIESLNLMNDYDLILASASPRRRELLAQIGLRCRVLAVDIDESERAGETAQQYVLRLAMHKAMAGQRLARQALPVVGADTIVLIDDKILGKPRDRDEALSMLSRLSGREHSVLTGVAVVQGNQQVSALSENTVRMRQISPQEQGAYWASGEPADKAGAYAIQGLAAVFVESLQGSFSAVMGLPLYETANLLEEFGIQVMVEHR